MYEPFELLVSILVSSPILLQEFLYYEPRENDKHLSATLNNILQRPRRNTPKLVKQTYSVVSSQMTFATQRNSP